MKGVRTITNKKIPHLSETGILDSHHHFWKVARGDYGWMTPDLLIARDFMPQDLRQSLQDVGVTKTILVQAAPTEAETGFLLDIAQTCDFVHGVCGWLDLDDDGFPDRLAHYMANPWWRSFRPMLQDLDDPKWILQPRVLRNLAYVAQMGVRFEVLTTPVQLPHAVAALRATPGLKAVVNHLSKPAIASRELEPWASLIAELADFPDVYCKLSGMVTEADPKQRNADIAPYVSHALDVFGVDRVMFGSDWPVALLAVEQYSDMMDVLVSCVSDRLSPLEMQKLFHDNAFRFYFGG